ncbi:metal-dependent hydrolase family protein [Nesterenkonia aerolata]|uniref:Amidohydrolase family protein n=1 Tax=Nesterenkonia aerolata TaxID=3074079 RepID=A0ABU2DNP8_9MICC|nr:amidohydrolase family protein [Nesterenkonia sp. LY-0111]MDR8018138.1 amidohydrolase family protein [Nesterenkonia sp. LY-0111]
MNDFLIRNCKLFDGETFHSDQDVRIEQGVVTDVSNAAERPGAGTDDVGIPTLDGAGKTLTPGIIDCHVHMTTREAGSLDAMMEPFSLQFFQAVEHLSRTLRAGVTTVRDAGGSDAGVKAALERGIVEGPRLRAAISIMSQTGGHGDGRLPSGAESPMLSGHPGRPHGVADGVDGVTRKARELFHAGADHIKICSTGGVLSPADDPRHSQFTEAEIRAIVAEAAAQGSYVMSHAQGSNGIKTALRAGVRSIEHGIYLDDEAIELFLETGAYLVPTLQAPVSVIRAADSGSNLPASVVEKARHVADVHIESIAKAHHAGVRLAMGTDAGVGPHGQNLEELELLSKVGLSAAEALRAATVNGADLMGIDDIGRVTRGAVADLVLFEGDVEADGLVGIQDRVHAVFQSGVHVV